MIKDFTRHHAVIIERQLALLPSRRHYIVSCTHCDFMANTLRESEAQDIRKAHAKNPYA